MGLIRRQFERLSRGKTFWRRLPPPFGEARVLVTPESALSHLKPGTHWCETELLLVADKFIKPGDVVWDVGSNLAIFGTASAIRCGTEGMVLCIEPDHTLASLIRKTISRLPATCARVEVLGAAVADEAGVGEFLIAERGRASNTLARYNGHRAMNVRHRQLVPIVTLDNLSVCARPPTFLKIDVEGAEVEVLKGAARLLATVRPAIYIEVGEVNTAIVARHLHDAGYNLYDPTMPIGSQKPLEKCRWNTLALPIA